MEALTLPAALEVVATTLGYAFKVYEMYTTSQSNKDLANEMCKLLRRIDYRLHQVQGQNAPSLLAPMLADITNDLTFLEKKMSSVLQTVQLRKMTNYLFANGKNSELSTGLSVARQCQMRIENVTLQVISMNTLSEKLEKLQVLLRKDTGGPLTKEQWETKQSMEAVQSCMESLSTSEELNDPSVSVTEEQQNELSPSDSTSSSDCDIDGMESQSIKSFGEVPYAMRTLIREVSRSGLQDERLREALVLIVKVWNGWRIPKEDVILDASKDDFILGSGATGVVYSATFIIKKDKEESKEVPVAVKEMQLSQKQQQQRIPDLMREILLQLTLDHDCILKTLGACWPSEFNVGKGRIPFETDSDAPVERVRVVMEKMTHNLEGALHTGLLTSFEQKMRVLTDIAAALTYLHKKRIVHRDLKPQNVLLWIREGEMIGFAKLADFGCSRKTNDAKLSKSFSSVTGAAGTTMFLPPEVLIDIENCRTRKSWDVWSFGLLMCSVLVPRDGFNVNAWSACDHARSGELVRNAHDWASHIEDDSLRSLAVECLTNNPEGRPTVATVHSRLCGDFKEPIQGLSYSSEGSESKTGNASDYSSYDRDTSVLQIADRSDHPSNEGKKNQEMSTVLTNDQTVGIQSPSSSSPSTLDETPNLQYDRGVQLFFGRGVGKDVQRALSLFRAAASAGHSLAITQLGHCYYHGIGVTVNKVEAVSLFSRSASLGDSRAMVNLANQYWHGEGVEQNLERAAALYEDAALRGSVGAQRMIAVCYLNGEGVVKSQENALSWFTRAANSGDPEAQNKLGLCLENGDAVAVDHVKAMTWYKLAAASGFADAQCNVGRCYEKGHGTDRNLEEAAMWYMRAYENGSRDAKHNLGLCYLKGVGLRMDPVKGMELLAEAVRAGSVPSMIFLGTCYKTGKGVQQNNVIAASLFQKAALCKSAAAQRMLGHCYLNGEGVTPSVDAGLKWMEKAANSGDSQSQFDLGFFFDNGLGGSEFVVKAVMWYRRAADSNFAEAQNNLGKCYVRGHGVTKDMGEAIGWFKKAVENGSTDAKFNLATCYCSRAGAYKDTEKGVALFSEAASAGHVPALFRMGKCYESGIGVECDKERAADLYRRAAENGIEQARRALLIMRVQMTFSAFTKCFHT